MNTITLSVPELKLALSGLGRIIPRHGIPVLQHIRVIRDDAGIVSLHAMDLDCCASFRFPQPITGPIMDFLVPFEALSRLLRSAKGQVALVHDGKSTIVRTFVGQSPIDHRLESLAVDKWPVMPAITALPTPITADAIKAIREAMDFASEDAGRPVLNSVCLDVSYKDAHYVVGTNGRALFSANSFKFALKEPVNVPTHKFWLWTGLPIDACTLSVQPPAQDEHHGWLKFQFSDWTFITKQQMGPFPNWRQVVPNEFKVSLDFNEDAVAAVLLAVSQLPGANDKDKPVLLRVEKGQVAIEAGSFKVPIAGVTISGKPMVIELNREYLILCFKIGLSTIQLTDELSPLVLTKDGKRAVIMPLKIGATHRAVAQTSPTPAPEPVTPPNESTPASETPAQPKEEPKTITTAAPTETAPESTMKEALKRIDDLREDLKQVLRDLNDTYTLLKQLEKEKKVTEKEVEIVRAKLREIQAVKI